MPFLTLPLVDDTFVRLLSGDSNFSTSTTLEMNSTNAQTYIKFPESPILDNVFIKQAILTLVVSNADNIGNYNLSAYRNVSDWVTSTITNNNKPGNVGTTITAIASSTPFTNVEIDVTEVIKYEYENEKRYGVMLTKTSGESGVIRFGSSENSDPDLNPFVTFEYFETQPFPPSLNFPSNITIDRSKNLTLQWSGPFHLETEIIWNDGTDHTVNIDGNFFEYTIPANTINAGSVTWKVRQRYQDVGFSEYSEANFIAADRPSTPVITTTVINTELPTITWTSVSQTAFNLKILKGEETVIEFSNFLDSTNYTLDQKLEDETSYTIELLIQDDSGLWSDLDTKTITSSFPKPGTPTFTIDNFGDYVHVNITNGLNTSRNEVLKLIDGNYVKIKDADVDGIEAIYELVSEKTETLKIRAFRDGGGFVDSTELTTTIKVNDSQIVTEDLQTIFNLSKSPQKNSNNTINTTEQMYAGRVLPVSIGGQIKQRSPNWSFETFDFSDVDKFNSILGKKCLFRDRRGFIGWFVIVNLITNDLNDSTMINIARVIEVSR